MATCPQSTRLGRVSIGAALLAAIPFALVVLCLRVGSVEHDTAYAAIVAASFWLLGVAALAVIVGLVGSVQAVVHGASPWIPLLGVVLALGSSTWAWLSGYLP